MPRESSNLSPWWMPQPADAPQPSEDYYLKPPLRPRRRLASSRPSPCRSKMVTKRTARSYMEEELAAEDREYQFQQQQRTLDRRNSAATLLESAVERTATNISTSSHSSTAFRSQLSSADLCATLSPVHMQQTAFLTGSNNSSSSSASISSSSYSSASSTTSDTNITVTAPHLFAEVLSSDPDDGSHLLAGAPHNFGEVLPGIYRSSYPKSENYGFLQQLGLKTIVTLVDKNFTEGYQKFMAVNHIQHHMFSMKGTKKEEIPLATMKAILRLVLDRRNYPMLIHCNHGKHRTGCVVAVVRKIEGWDTDRVVQEYKAYAGRKVRDCDVKYIRAFELSSIAELMASCDLALDNVDDGDSNAIAGPVPETAVGFRIPNFFRATFFSMTMLFIWMLSGTKMAPPHKR